MLNEASFVTEIEMFCSLGTAADPLPLCSLSSGAVIPRSCKRFLCIKRVLWILQRLLPLQKKN